MEGGIPMLNYLLQHTLRSLCTCSSDSSGNSSKWVYAVFWKILPRFYPPPKWDNGVGLPDRAKGNKRNWILVWEDGFCDLYECEREGSGYIKGRFGADTFFKLSHEVYNYGEGLVGKVAADNSHRWVFRERPNEDDNPSCISSWNVPIDPQPRAWEFQFNSGIQTIAIISVREGIIQLGSFHKIDEDLNHVISIQRKFSYLQSIPGISAPQRPYFPVQHPYTLNPNNPHAMTMIQPNEPAYKRQQIGSKRLVNGERPDNGSIKSINLGYNSPQNGLIGSPPLWHIPPLFPSLSCSFRALLAKLPSNKDNGIDAVDEALINGNNGSVNKGVISHQCVRVDNCGVKNEAEIGDINVEISRVLEYCP